MEKYTERIKSMYNDCAKIFARYLATRDMGEYNRQWEAVCRKYGCEEDIKELIWWWMPKVQTIHDAYVKEIQDGEHRKVV